MADPDKGIVKDIVEDVVPDNKVEDTQLNTNKEPETKEFSSIEKQAMEMGWRPREEFNGDDDDFIDAKEFVRRKPLFDKIESNSKELKQVRRALENLSKHYNTVREVEYNRALASLKDARKQALTDGDGDAFTQLDDQIKVVEKQAEDIRIAKDTPIVQDEPVNQEFALWQERNPWYNSKRYMRVYADDIGTDLHRQGLSPAEVLKRVDIEVRKQFPNEFRNPRKDTAPDVESNRTNTSTKSKKDDYPLTAEQREIMNSFVRNKVMSADEYISSLRKLDAAQ
jgi:hypothetical protein